MLGRNKVVKNDVACPFCIIHHIDIYSDTLIRLLAPTLTFSLAMEFFVKIFLKKNICCRTLNSSNVVSIATRFKAVK